MTLVVATATQKEMKAVLKGFNGRGRIGCQLPAQGQWCESPINDHQCLLAVTGVGPLNAALTLGRILGEHFGIAAVLNLGIAGSFDKAMLPLGATVLADKEIFPEFGLRTADGIDPKGIAFPQWSAPEDEATCSSRKKAHREPQEHQEEAIWDSITLTPLASLKQLDLARPDALCGTSLTVAGVTGTPAYADMLKARYNALTENMEGFALALGCRQAGIPFIELRTVSNIVGSRAPEDWKLDEALLALGATARTLFA